MEKFGASQPLRRIEDRRFITGTGRYTDDITRPGQAHAFILRSPHAHARIRGIDTQAARAMPGVLAIFTAADLAADGIPPLPCIIPLKNRDGSGRADPPRPALAGDKVRHVGDQVAMIVAESLAEARDAAEAVIVDYEELPPVTDMRRALSPEAPLIHEAAPGNLCFDWQNSDPAAAEAAFAGAHQVVALEVVNNRVVVASMETRAALAEYDPATERLTLHTNTQGVHLLKRLLAEAIFKIPPEKVRVVTPDVGGGFGMKIYLYPEQVLACYAARKIGRPVKWTSERGDAFLSDTQGRDNLTRGELALDDQGRFLALRVSTLANLGGYVSTFAPFIPTVAGTRVLSVQYRIPIIHAAVKGVLTNTVPVDAYRGAGRPEANYLVERLIEVAARRLGISAIELRRRNFIPADAFPYQTPTGLKYDSGAFAENLDRALKAADHSGLAARKAAAKARGRLRGLGIACYLEATAGPTEERAEIRFGEDGLVHVLVGTQSNGQGHETGYTQLISHQLGVPIERIVIHQGDSDLIRTGGGTGGARSLYAEGGAILGASEQVIEKGRVMAGHLLEAAPVDIEFGSGQFRIAGTDRKIGILDVAAAARDPARRPKDLDGGLDSDAKITAQGTFPNGCHIAEVEIDPETGRVAVVAYHVVDDMGRVINPLIVEGQVHGGIGQGIGQALLERTLYDAESGQLLTGSFMDYTLPRADDLPDIDFQLNEVPCRTNPLGVKGAGEAGSVGAPQAVINAICDALAPLGIEHIDMPATPEKVWRAIQEKAV
ncbi:MAG: xanthine dehydrogenase family protein molybdopterin-binding subunit [Alphaproteobacteria bacterium]|nr:xanthine dehydrogenase family protein molybdopterin-binding subunit [Alphaproteobacteria bacterium]